MKLKIFITLCLALVGLTGSATDTTIHYPGSFTITYSVPFKDTFDLNPDGSVTYKRTYFVDSSRNQQATIPAALLYKFDSTYTADNYMQVSRKLIQEAETTAINVCFYSLLLGCISVCSILSVAIVAMFTLNGRINQDNRKKWFTVIVICWVILCIILGIMLSRLDPALFELGKALI